MRKNGRQEHINWRQANYKIIRKNNGQNYDLRENDPEAGIDVYAGLSSFMLNDKVRQNFRRAKVQALKMIKDLARKSVNQQSVQSLNALTLDNFLITRQGSSLIGAVKSTATEAAQWECTWIEGNPQNPRRTWKFVIDSDDPLPESPQEPHVGWTVSAAAGTQPAVNNTFGHVWLDRVPVKR